MAEVYAPIAKDESFKTSENPSRNVADVLAQELARIAENILPPNAEDIAYDNTASGLTATNVQDAIDEVISSQADVIADTMADLTENKTATVTDGVADFETIDGSLVKSLVVEIEPSQSGTGTPSPDNIRPITGWTQEDVTVKGRNLLETPYYQGASYTTNGVTFTENADGTVSASGTASANAFYRLMSVLNPSNRLLDYLSGKTVSGSPSGGSTSKYLMQMVIDRSIVVVREYGDSEVIPDLSQYYGAEEIYLAVSVRSGYTATDLVFKPMITVSGGTYATFEPYHGKTYTIPFGQPVCGGTLDVLTGELTIDRAMAQITANNITFNATNNRAMLSLTTASLPSAVNNFSGVNCIADRFEGISNQSGASTGVGVYANNNYVAICGYKTSLAEYQTWLTDNPVTVVYEMATPTTLSLTPQTVKALVGENHISASTGDVTICKYSKLVNGDDIYIADDNAVLISAMGTDESGNTKASKAYSTGDYFYKDGAMCKVLTSIASGATLTLNTNYSALTLADILKSLA